MMVDAALVLGCLTLGMDPVLAVSIVDELSEREPNVVLVDVPRGNGPVDGRPFVGRLAAVSADEAAALATGISEGLTDAGREGPTVRLGLMGVDAAELPRLGGSIREALDPCTNLGLGERLYLEALDAATAAGLSGDAAVLAALRGYLGNVDPGPVGVDAAEAVRARRPASERWLAAHRTSAVAVRSDVGASDREGPIDVPSGALRIGSSIVAWTPRAAVGDASRGRVTPDDDAPVPSAIGAAR